MLFSWFEKVFELLLKSIAVVTVSLCVYLFGKSNAEVFELICLILEMNEFL
jgi:hypothetical protein